MHGEIVMLEIAKGGILMGKKWGDEEGRREREQKPAQGLNWFWFVVGLLALLFLILRLIGF